MKTNSLKIISGSHLKILAMLTMLIDHIACFVLSDYPQISHALFTLGTKHVTIYYIMRSIGRIAFPIYCFLLVEGFAHTRDKIRYGINLLLFALISEMPWNFIHSGSLLYSSQNVFFTLLFGYVGLCIIEYYKDRAVARAIGLVGLLVLVNNSAASDV